MNLFLSHALVILQSKNSEDSSRNEDYLNKQLFHY